MTVRFYRTPADFWALMCFCCWHFRIMRYLLVAIGSTAFVILVVGVYLGSSVTMLKAIGYSSVASVVAASVIMLLTRRAMLLVCRCCCASEIGEHEVELRPDMIRDTSPGGTISHRWTVVRDVKPTKTHVFVVVGLDVVYVIPTRAFSTADDLSCFVQLAKHCLDRWKVA